MKDRRKVHTIEEKGSHIQGSQPKGSQQLFRYIDGKKVLLDKLPTGYKVLSDGQVWQPTLVIKPVVIDDPIRKERAERYWNWYGCNIKDGRMLGAS